MIPCGGISMNIYLVDQARIRSIPPMVLKMTGEGSSIEQEHYYVYKLANN